MRRKKLARWIFKATFVILIMLGIVWLLLPERSADAATQVSAREESVSVSAPAAQATIPLLPTRPPTPTSAPISAPADVPEADTLILFAGGIGGLATWIGWQWRKRRTLK